MLIHSIQFFYSLETPVHSFSVVCQIQLTLVTNKLDCLKWYMTPVKIFDFNFKTFKIFVDLYLL